MTDFSAFETKARTQAIAGDFGLLIAKLRDPNQIINQMDRNFLADCLLGKHKKRGRRRGSFAKDLEAYEAVEWLVRIDGVKRDAAEMQVAMLLGETDRNIRRRVEKCFVKGPSGDKEKARYTVMSEWRLQLAAEHPDSKDDFRPSILRADIPAN